MEWNLLDLKAHSIYFFSSCHENISCAFFYFDPFNFENICRILSLKGITPMTSHIFLVKIYGLNSPNYFLRARLRFMNFTQMEWTV